MIDLELVTRHCFSSPPLTACLVTLNRPAVQRDDGDHVRRGGILPRAVGDDRDIRVVILTGAGKAFCAGYDLDEAEELASLSALGMWIVRNARRARSVRCARSRSR